MHFEHTEHTYIPFQARLFMTAAAVLFFAGITLSCGTGELKAPAPDARFIAAHTGGIVSLYDPIKVVFNDPRGGEKPVSGEAFRLSPPAQGSVSWENDYTLVFTPSRALKPRTRYQAVVTPASFTADGGVPFAFEFGTSPAAFEVRFDPVRTDSPEGIRISGTITAEKGLSDSGIEKTLRYGELSKPEWIHEETVHRFAFPPVERGKQDRTVAVRWNGGPLGSSEKGEVSFLIPELNRFEVLDIQQPDPNTLLVTFSSPLKKNQDLRGFISLSGNTGVRYSVEDNIARIYGSDGIPEDAVLSIQDMTDAYGGKLYRPVQYTVTRKWELPAARFGNGGNILPTTQGTSLVVETKNLCGLIVEAFEIPDRNMTQFLQVNDLAGTRELYRVGEPVWVKSFDDLPWSDSDKNQWVRRGLDLSELSRSHPDSMFRIRITFRHRHVKYQCESNHADFSGLEFPDDTLPPYPGDTGVREKSNWDYYENHSRNSSDWYRFRTDPCHPAFYTPFSDHDITVGRNVLVSDLGLLVKRGVSGEWLAAATRLGTADPASGTELQLVSFQGRVLQTVKTGRDGLASFKPEPAAAFLYGYNGKNRAYLRLNDSLALATSHFDLAGERVDDGVKGMIYGDRGVWRPGDTLFLTFLLEDTKNILPPDHPVLFELEDPQGRIAETRTYTSSVNGFYAIPAATAETAPTGDWIARVRVGGKVFTKNLKIETVMPNRLKMTLDTGSSSGGYLDSSKTPMTLEAAWLHGASAPNLKADISVVFSDRETTFPGYSEYTFRDNSRGVSSERHMIYEGRLDGKSQGKFQVELSPGGSVPGKLYARFLTRVFEPSGVFSSEQISMDFSPYKRYIGIKLPKGDEARNMLLTDTDHPAEIVVVDSDGKPVRERVQLECALYEMKWRWWWEKGGNEAADFTSALSRSPVMRETIQVENGKGSWNFRVNYPSWGRYLVIIRDKNGGHAASQSLYID
ncbi:MAG: alpha-2-macroglobulin, partial [Spirochaetaceae bacterium]|nr:alpha-2-macroglobulin [Spirochaetaceae bacterium]